MKRLPALVFVFVALALLVESINTSETIPSPFDQKRLQQIESCMNPKAKACVDFYRYACDEWDGPGNIRKLEETVQQETSQVLKHLHLSKELKFLQEINNFYASYMEVKNTEPLQYLKWLSVYENIQWSLLADNAQERNPEWKWSMDWLELLASLRRFGLNNIFFQETTTSRLDDPFKSVIELKRPLVSGLSDFETEVYFLGDIVDANTVESLANFQLELLTFTMDLIKSEEGDDDFNPKVSNFKLVSLEDLKMPWLNKYLRVLLNQNEVDPKMELYVQSVEYLKKIYDYLSKFDNRLICDYIQYKLLVYLMEDDRDHFEAGAVNMITDYFPLAMQWLHGWTHKELETVVPVIRNLFANLKNKFKSNFSHNSGEISVKYLQAKLDNLELVVFDKPSEELDHYYQHLNLMSSDYYGNRLRVNKFKFQVLHSGLTAVYGRTSMQYLDFRPVEGHKKDYPYHLPTLYPRLNVIFLPLTLLQEPFYKHGMADTYLYSSLGFLLAHEIAKAFDPLYVHIDSNGVFRRTERSDAGDLDDGQAMNPVIDDLAGLTLAYDTFAEYHGKLLQTTWTIHKTTFTVEKIFFLNYAHNFCAPFCSFSRMGVFHTYDACARVNTPVRHFDKFRQVFGCSALSNFDLEAFSLWPSKKN